MPAFSHCFLKRFMAFSNDSPSLTRTPGILGITTFRLREGPAKTRQYMLGCQAVKRAGASPAARGPWRTSRLAVKETGTATYAVPVSDLAGNGSDLAGSRAPLRLTRSRNSLPVRKRIPRLGLTGITSPVLGLRPL